MDIFQLFLFYGIFTIVLSGIISLLLSFFGKNKEKKLCKKHLLKRKNIFLTLSFISLLVIWSQIESAFSPTTLSVLWGLHILGFIGFLGFSIREFIQDKKRIEAAQRRRKARENT